MTGEILQIFKTASVTWLDFGLELGGREGVVSNGTYREEGVSRVCHQ